MSSSNSVSVVIPTYNSSHSIEKCIMSSLEQSVRPKEVIVVDDSSDDNTVEIVSLLQAKYTDFNIVLIRNAENRGPSIARNVAVAKAKGEWVAFLDSDDYWRADKLKCQLDIASEFKSDIVATEVCWEWPLHEANNCMCSVVNLKGSQVLFSNKLITPSVIVKRAILLPFNENMKYAEDLELWLRILRRGAKCSFIKKPLVRLGKPPYLNSGLSSNLFFMELGELKAILCNYKINPLLSFFATIYSIIKFFRRISLAFLSRAFRRVKSNR